MTKSAIREEYRQKRRDLGEAERDKLDDLMLIRFQTIDLPFIHTLLSYWPITENHEPNTHLFASFLKFRNPEMRLCYPVSNFETLSMQAVATDIDTPFEKRSHNIHEPKEGEVIDPSLIDLVFVPLLAVDREGYRVGYGKGFYDQYLPSLRPDCIKAGFAYFDPVPTITDKREFDVPLDLCITPEAVYVF